MISQNNVRKGNFVSSEELEVKKQLSQIVEKSCYSYNIQMCGTLDGFNTTYYLDTYGNHKREEIKFEPNVSLTIENIGDTDVIAPRIVINGRRNWYSVNDILNEIISDSMSEEEKALAIFRFISDISIQAHNNDLRVSPPYPDEGSNPSRNQFRERANPVKAVNCYYCSGCSLSAANFVILCRHAGLEARAIWMSERYTYHCVAEVKYNGKYHLFDPEQRAFFLGLDNATVASYEEVYRCPRIKIRTHMDGFAQKEENYPKESYCGVYPPYSMPVEDDWVTTMDIILRPGESFIRRWDNMGRFGRAFNSRNNGQKPPYRLSNGKIVYKPDLSRNIYRKGMVFERNIKSFEDDGVKPNLHMGTIGQPSIIVHKVASPYPIVGGVVSGTFYRKNRDDVIKIYFSSGDQDWIEIWSAKEVGLPEENLGAFETHIDISYQNVGGSRGLDSKFETSLIDPLNTAPKYEYYIKYEFNSSASPYDVGIDNMCLETIVQMSNTSLPALSVGENKVEYTDKTRGPHRVKITHVWYESSESTPPKPPFAPIFPEDNQKVSLNSLKYLEWEPSTDPDGKGMLDYHLQVSPFLNFLAPVSPNFDRLTLDNQPRWKIPEGWLTEERKYYWRIRGRNQWGAWSNWSKPWSFTVVKEEYR